MSEYRFRFTVTKALDFCVEAKSETEALRFIENYTASRFSDNVEDLLTINHDIRAVSNDSNLPYDMVFYRPDEIVRNLEV